LGIGLGKRLVSIIVQSKRDYETLSVDLGNMGYEYYFLMDDDMITYRPIKKGPFIFM